MHMLGHEHESGQTIPMPGGRSIKTFREHRSPDIIGQQRHSPVTTEGQFPDVTGMIKMTNLFSMGSLHQSKRYPDSPLLDKPATCPHSQINHQTAEWLLLGRRSEAAIRPSICLDHILCESSPPSLQPLGLVCIIDDGYVTLKIHDNIPKSLHQEVYR